MIPDPCVRVVFPKIGDRKRKLLSNIGTGKENVSQKQGPENNFTLKSWDPKKSFRSPLLRTNFFSGPHFWDTFSFPVLLLGYIFFSGPHIWEPISFPVPISEIHFSFQVPNSETHTISRILRKMCFLSLFLSFGGKEP